VMMSRLVGSVSIFRLWPVCEQDAAVETGAKHVVISIFDHPRYNGGGQAIVELIAGRLAADFEVTVVTAARHRGAVVRDRVCYQMLPLWWAGPRAGQLLYHALLPLAARRIRHDLWIESFTPPFSTSFLPLFSRARVLGFAQSLSGEEMSSRYRLPFFLIERFGLRFYRDFIVLNEADRTRVRRYSPSANVQLIPNGVVSRQLDQQRVGRGKQILFLGRIDVKAKGLDLLLTAYQRSGLSMPLVIAGSGTRHEERKLETLLAATGKNVRWVGQVSGADKQELLEGSAFLVLPSRQETFGLAALEGMSYGNPVLHFDLPPLRWMDGDVRVPPFDVDALAGEMRRLAADEAARCELGRLAHMTAQRYRRDVTEDLYFRLVRELLNASRPGAHTEGDLACQ
jgi:glycosyltransferase involved in cell wall biosynthesis